MKVKHTKILLIFLLAISLCVGVIFGITKFFTDLSHNKETELHHLRSIPFSYTFHGETHTNDFLYSDEFFSLPSSSFHTTIAAASLAISLSSSGYTGPWSEQDTNVKATMSSLGCKDAHSNEDYGVEPAEMTSAVTICHKTIDVANTQSTLFIIAPRSGNYKKEWASNFRLGTSDTHEGFAQATQRILPFIKEYISQHKNGNSVAWISGYSRGGAIAGLLAKELNDSGTFVSEHIYAYTFESPATIKNASGTYTHIHHLVSSDDIVTALPLASWGYTRPGITHNISNNAADDTSLTWNKESVQAQLSHMKIELERSDFAMKTIDLSSQGMKIIDDTTQSKVTQSSFLDSFITSLSSHFYLETSDNYVQNLQEGVSYLSGLFYGISAEERSQAFKDITANIQSNFIMYGLEGKEHTSFTSNVIGILTAHNITIDKEKLERTLPSLAEVLITNALNNIDKMATLYANFSSFSYAHEAVVYFAFLRSIDFHYSLQG
ncbi:MAG: hypothetical protein J6M18_04760 [Actinomycetaceae bacterium]|nr:hypothetical protein [Actinomycetaceae bacterium]